LQLGDIHRLEGALDAAAPVYEESVALARECGELRGLILGLLGLASVLAGRGSRERSRELVGEALAIVEQTGSKPLGAFALLFAAGIAASSGVWPRAAQLHGAAIAQCAQMALRVEPADAAFFSPLIAKAREALGAAAFAAAEDAGHSLSYDTALAEARAWLAER
jgi:hypothetical protein